MPNGLSSTTYLGRGLALSLCMGDLFRIHSNRRKEVHTSCELTRVSVLELCSNEHTLDVSEREEFVLLHSGSGKLLTHKVEV